jgi:ribosomal protein S18 acetylase RimI-like enzyme
MPIEPSSIDIYLVTEFSEDLYQACQVLVPQLTNNNPPPTREQLTQLINSQASHFFVARDNASTNNQVIGLATLIIYHVPTGMRGYIEDVVVDGNWRGQGIGEALTQACLGFAKQAGCPQVMLTCNPGRTAANRLYQRMGFEQRKTNVYRYSFARNRNKVKPAYF